LIKKGVGRENKLLGFVNVIFWRGEKNLVGLVEEAANQHQNATAPKQSAREEADAIVPEIWSFEIANSVFVSFNKRKRIE
jgi:hypothetical protein